MQGGDPPDGDESRIAPEVLADVAEGYDVAVGTHAVWDCHAKLDDYVRLVVEWVVETEGGVDDEIVDRGKQARCDVSSPGPWEKSSRWWRSPATAPGVAMVFDRAAAPPTARAAEATTVTFRNVRHRCRGRQPSSGLRPSPSSDLLPHGTRFGLRNIPYQCGTVSSGFASRRGWCRI